MLDTTYAESPPSLPQASDYQRRSNDQKAAEILSALRNMPNFSLRIFHVTVLTSEEASVKNSAGVFIRDGGPVGLMELWFSKNARGPYTEIANSLRVRAEDATVQSVQDFRLRDLTAKYAQCPDLFHQNPDDGRTLITSIALNPRSRVSNLHQRMNGFMFWDNKMLRRLVQMMNRLGVCVSYQARTDGRNSVTLARRVAADPTKLKMLPYDNFNWVSQVYESSATHRKVTHDQVSALLVVVNIPDGPDTLPAQELTCVERFEDAAGARLRLPAQQSLEEILPSREDQKLFRNNCIKHIRHMYSLRGSEGMSDLSSCHRIVLPSNDQEQGSTRENMLVLHHYFIDVLQLPKNVFEHIMFFVLGDRLTTARERAAHDQRALDRSEYRADQLGLMHECRNFIENVGKNYWGDSEDLVGLASLRKILPNREETNLRKFNFYAWLRFLDVILRSLIVRASMVALNITSVAVLAKHKFSNFAALRALCTTIADTFLLPSVDRLEADGIKKIRGNTISGNAVLLTHDLMTFREMRHAIKHGHPSRVRRMLNYWAPMFYAGGSYNYAHETMELLHNIIHDWPTQTAEILEAGMIFNTQGDVDTHLEGDLGEHVEGSNATPALLEKIVPALGHIQNLTTQMYKDLGVEDVNQHHAKVRQHKDVEILTAHFTSSKLNLFVFTRDKISEQTVVDLYRHGLRRLSGSGGGHAKHLARHKLRFRTRHEQADPTMMAIYRSDRELEEGRDSQPSTYIHSG
ncbi:hypothetical protein R3P38DRAFT_3321577 [Favolaschia claudopus]|uniref:DUF6589 domain-containing protein n=1 Tax=Favolaschia claudopus TaxID=2862362 RepID=A0AAW0AU90_9AGAR